MTDSRWRYLRAAIAVACGIAVAVFLLALLEHFGNAFMSRNMLSNDAETESAAVSLPSSLGVISLHETPQTIPDIRFKDASGRDLSLKHFQGKVVLLNIWATWCVPMPARDAHPRSAAGQARRARV